MALIDASISMAKHFTWTQDEGASGFRNCANRGLYSSTGWIDASQDQCQVTFVLEQGYHMCKWLFLIVVCCVMMTELSIHILAI